MTDDHAIRIRGASKSFGKAREVRAVRSLDLDVPRGSLCGFLGPNGAGKSTTIRMIMSIIYPDEGSIDVLGGSALQSKDRIGYRPEERGLYRKMRAGEFLEYIAQLKGVSRSDAKRRAAEWLERVELSGALRKRCHELSKGMQQKVQFVSALIHDPELLILDEPFSGLDPVNAALMARVVRELNQEGRTIIFSTHILHQAEQLCDRVVLINHGEKILDATLDEVRTVFDPRTVVVKTFDDGVDFSRFIGVIDETTLDDGSHELHLREDADPHAIMRAIVDTMPVRSIELRRVSLEEVFVRLVMKDEGKAAAEKAREELSHA